MIKRREAVQSVSGRHRNFELVVVAVVVVAAVAVVVVVVIHSLINCL